MEQAVGGLLMGESAEVAFEMGSPTGANVVHPVGKAEAQVARLLSGAV